MRFVAEPYDRLDKRRVITSDDELTLYVDYDDVDTASVDKQINELVNVMNHHYASKDAAVARIQARDAIRARSTEGGPA